MRTFVLRSVTIMYTHTIILAPFQHLHSLFKELCEFLNIFSINPLIWSPSTQQKYLKNTLSRSLSCGWEPSSTLTLFIPVLRIAQIPQFSCVVVHGSSSQTTQTFLSKKIMRTSVLSRDTITYSHTIYSHPFRIYRPFL